MVHHTSQYHGNAREEEHEGTVGDYIQEENICNNPETESSPARKARYTDYNTYIP